MFLPDMMFCIILLHLLILYIVVSCFPALVVNIV